MSDDAELNAVRKRAPDFGLFAPPEPETRHVAAMASVAASATPEETRIVGEIQAHLRGRFRFTADDVAELLTAHGVPRTGPQAGAIRRRYASRCINAGKGKWWTKVDEAMTQDAVRSGRRIAVWQVIQFPEDSR